MSLRARQLGRLRSLTFLVASGMIAAAASVAASVAYAAFVVPTLTGHVVDSANLLGGQEASSLASALQRISDNGGPQIVVLTVPNLGGEPIESASIQVTDKWKLGGAKKDDGVLLLVALEDRKMRIEVGQGLEGVLTDLESKRIIADTMTPYFRAGRPSDGIVAGIHAIISKAAPDALASLGDRPTEVKRSRRGGSPLSLPVLIFIAILFSIFAGRGGRRGRGGAGGFVTGLALGALSGRGGGGWSGGGGGGFSGGGGGGFSGGGASGGW